MNTALNNFYAIHWKSLGVEMRRGSLAVCRRGRGRSRWILSRCAIWRLIAGVDSCCLSGNSLENRWSRSHFVTWLRLKLKRNFNSVLNFPECADIPFQVARGRLKGNFIVHNSASTSNFCRRQIVLAFKEEINSEKFDEADSIDSPTCAGSPSTWWNVCFLKTIDFTTFSSWLCIEICDDGLSVSILVNENVVDTSFLWHQTQIVVTAEICKNYGVCNIKILRDYKRVTLGCNIKKYVLWLCEMVRPKEIKDMPKGLRRDFFLRELDHFQEIIMKYDGRFAAEITQIY